jgi:hypothetical protein
MSISENILRSAFLEMIRDDDTMTNSWWSVGAWRSALYKYYDFDEDVMLINNKVLSKAILKATDDNDSGVHTAHYTFTKPKRQKRRFFYAGKEPVLPRTAKEAERFREKSDTMERRRQQYWPVSIDSSWKERIANSQATEVDTQLAAIRRMKTIEP